MTLSGEQELIISTKQSSSVFSSWDLQIETIQEGFYGYGYGYTDNFNIVGIHGTGLCTVDISTGGGPYSGNILGTIESGLGWEVGNSVQVNVSSISTIFSGTIDSYNSSTGSFNISVSSHSSSVVLSSPTSCTLSNPESPSLDYFNVIGLAGSFLGYGYKDENSPSNITDFETSYSYGWGYEYADFVFSNQEDTICVRARVLKDNVPQENIRVFFWGSPTVILTESSVLTDSNGYATTKVSINDNVNINQIDGWGYNTTIATPENFRSISGAGGRTVSAMIYEGPESDDGELKIYTGATQKIYTEVVFNLNIGSYAFNEGEDL